MVGKASVDAQKRTLLICAPSMFTVSSVTSYRSSAQLKRNKKILMYFRVSTVQCPKVIYVSELLLFRVVQQDSQR